MNAIEYALNQLKYSDIPDEILEDGFKDQNDRYSRRRISVESLVKEKIISGRVKPDLDNIGGVMIEIPLAGISYEAFDDFSRVFYIPHDLTLGRKIVQVNRINLLTAANYKDRIPGQHSHFQTVSPYERSIQSVITSHSPIPNVSTAEIELLGDNVVKVHDYMNLPVDVALECKVEYSKDLLEIKNVYYRDFAELVNLAVKAYLYRNLSLALDRTRLEGGRDFGRYKEFVDTWADANQMYLDLLDQKWFSILLLNDPRRKNKHILRSGKIKV